MEISDEYRAALGRLLVEVRNQWYDGNRQAAYSDIGVNAATWARAEKGQPLAERSLVAILKHLFPHTGGDWRRLNPTTTSIGERGVSVTTTGTPDWSKLPDVAEITSLEKLRDEHARWSNVEAEMCARLDELEAEAEGLRSLHQDVADTIDRLAAAIDEYEVVRDSGVLDPQVMTPDELMAELVDSTLAFEARLSSGDHADVLVIRDDGTVLVVEAKSRLTANNTAAAMRQLRATAEVVRSRHWTSVQPVLLDLDGADWSDVRSQLETGNSHLAPVAVLGAGATGSTLQEAARDIGEPSRGQQLRDAAAQAGEPPADDPDDMEPR
jgi:hypothetical protein